MSDNLSDKVIQKSNEHMALNARRASIRSVAGSSATRASVGAKSGHMVGDLDRNKAAARR